MKNHYSLLEIVGLFLILFSWIMQWNVVAESEKIEKGFKTFLESFEEAANRAALDISNKLEFAVNRATHDEVLDFSRHDTCTNLNRDND